jgi:hypothetical protein
VYLFAEDGRCIVLQTGTSELKVLAESILPGRILASPAVAGNDLFVRTDSHLYCLRGSGD